MDYKKSYEDALEKAKIWQKHLYEIDEIDYGKELEYIFPELKESEDEKIRKEIISSLKWANHKGVYDKHIAWLEKQGEPTEINPSEFDLRLNKLLKQFESLPKEELITNLSYYLNVIQNDGTYKIEKQGEQKSAWSEEDDIGLDDALWCCKQAASIAKDENDMGNTWYAEKWLKSLKQRIKL